MSSEAVIKVWSAQPGPQSSLLQCPLPDVFFGGARGGGKTDGLLGDFLAHAGRYGSRARGILFRRTMPELDEVIARSQDIFGPLGWKYGIQKHDWTAPNRAFLRLRYLDNDADAQMYQGHSYTWEGFDELTHWPKCEPIDKLWACMRSPHGIPCMRRSTGNPGGPGHVWVKKRYRIEHPLVPFEYEPQPGYRNVKGEPLLIKAVFIPSRLDDNPLLMANDPMYESRLAAAGSIELFKAWRYGNWDVLAGQFFDVFDPLVHVVQPEEALPPSWAKCWISMDWGFNDDCVVLWHRTDENGRVYTYREFATSGMIPSDIGRTIGSMTPASENIQLFPMSRDAFHKRDSPHTIAYEIGQTIPTRMAQPMLADQDRIGGWQLMYQMLKSGMWKISNACPTLIDAIPQLIRDVDRNPNDCMESLVDHAPDAARYGLKTYVRESRQGIEEVVRKRLTEIPDETSRSIAWMQEKEKNRFQHRDWMRPRRWIG